MSRDIPDYYEVQFRSHLGRNRPTTSWLLVPMGRLIRGFSDCPLFGRRLNALGSRLILTTPAPEEDTHRGS